jgi:hypothetical protein
MSDSHSNHICQRGGEFKLEECGVKSCAAVLDYLWCNEGGKTIAALLNLLYMVGVER